MNRLFSFRLDPDNCIAVNYNYNLGHTAGQGQLSPDGKYNLVHIPKNASSEIKNVLNTWQHSNYFEIKNSVEHLVILRDPTDRWISGVAEFLVGNNAHTGFLNSNLSVDEIEQAMNNRLVQNLLFDFAIFDGHTIPQCWYLRGLNLDNIVFFYFDQLVIPRILEYTKTVSEVKVANTSLTNPRKLAIIKKLKSLLQDNPELQHKIDKNYYADHQLFDKIKFHY